MWPCLELQRDLQELVRAGTTFRRQLNLRPHKRRRRPVPAHLLHSCRSSRPCPLPRQPAKRCLTRQMGIRSAAAIADLALALMPPLRSARRRPRQRLQRRRLHSRRCCHHSLVLALLQACRRAGWLRLQHQDCRYSVHLLNPPLLAASAAAVRLACVPALTQQLQCRQHMAQLASSRMATACQAALAGGTEVVSPALLTVHMLLTSMTVPVPVQA